MSSDATEMASTMFPELDLIDSLINGLELLLTESDETPLRIETTDRPKRATYRILNVTSPTERRMHAAEAVYLDGSTLILRCNDTQAVRQTQMEVTVRAEKTGRGEVIAVLAGKVRELQRVRGGYDVALDILDMRKHKITPAQKLRDCVNHGDAAGWNRWCHDIVGIIELNNMDLRSVDLNGYDLCCVDFAGSDFTGANLSGAIMAGSDISQCILENVTAVGTDLFNARMNRAQAALVQQSGMPEVESVVFENVRYSQVMRAVGEAMSHNEEEAGQ